MTPSYLDVPGGPVLVLLHEPAGERRDTGVLLCPPFGWEDVCSYRPRRAWAESLAAAGYPTLRLDLPGTGDSAGGADDPGLVARSVAAVAAAGEWLRGTGCTRVAVVGIGLGGLYACLAGSFDEYVLWAVPGRGKAVIREVRAFARLGSGEVLAGGALAANGFLLSAETVADLDAVDLTSRPNAARALLLDRDGVPVDDALRAAFPDAAVEPGPGWAAFMARPQESVPPYDVMARVEAWLGETSAPAPARPAPQPVCTARIGVLTERLLGPAVVTEPLRPNGLTAVLLNAGAIRRIGPNRMWVEAARRWAARGVTVVRADLPAIGDADGADRWGGDDGQFYGDEYRASVTGLLDALVAGGLPPRFLLGGLCSGAYWSFHVAQEDPRVSGAVLLNPMTFAYDPYVDVLRTSRVLRRIWQPSGWRKLLTGGSSAKNVGAVLRATATRLTQGRKEYDPTPAEGLDRLRDNGVRTLLVFSNGEALRDELAAAAMFDRLDQWPNLDVRLLDGPADVHTLQPLDLQREVHALLDAHLDTLLHQ